MRLQEFLDTSAVSLLLRGTTKDEVLEEMVGLLRLDPRATQALAQLVHRREHLGSTGFGRGIAIPHARSLVVNRLRVAFGRHVAGVEFGAMDQAPVHAIFLIVAPPHEVSNQYLPVLGKVAQLCQQPDVPERLARLEDPAALLALLADRGV
jgi:mannitol/fructose-specific phosphotransferase system IIA component (Ntr-type)